jgi:hypothetical protein
MKPIKIVLQGEEWIRKSNRGNDWSKYIVCTYGNITMKPHCTINMLREK